MEVGGGGRAGGRAEAGGWRWAAYAPKMMAVWMYEARNVALSPPNIVYRITPTGIRKSAVTVGMFEAAFITAAPPSSSMPVTIRLVAKGEE